MARFPTSALASADRHVVLPDVDAGGARQHRNLGPVVDDDRRAVTGARDHSRDEIEQAGGAVVFRAHLQAGHAGLEKGLGDVHDLAAHPIASVRVEDRVERRKVHQIET